MYITDKHCPRCGNKLLRIDPPWRSWEYWCVFCDMLVVPREDLDKAWEEAKKRKYIGVVIGVNTPFEEPSKSRIVEMAKEKLREEREK